MKSVDDIVAAAEQLKPTQFLHLRKALDRIEAKLWETALARNTSRMKKAGLTDAKVDRMVARRRRESRR